MGVITLGEIKSSVSSLVSSFTALKKGKAIILTFKLKKILCLFAKLCTSSKISV